jgi:hypothetical protein|tara:strand:- start:86 stop:445 length:360 start_codon:yes stop_codon:yes gene_type:complete
MKSILIDVKKQEVKEVEHDDTLASIYKHVDCGTFDVVNIDGVNSIYVDDEGLFVEDQLYFKYTGTTNSVSLAGNGLVLGVDEEGETTSPTLMLEEVKKAVTFLPEGFEINPSIKVTAWH